MHGSSARKSTSDDGPAETATWKMPSLDLYPRPSACGVTVILPWPRVTNDVPGEPGVAVAVQAAYDAVASAYHDQLGNELAGKALDRAVLQAFTELVGDGAIADVGCGPGHITRFVTTRNARVVGIDIAWNDRCGPPARTGAGVRSGGCLGPRQR